MACELDQEGLSVRKAQGLTGVDAGDFSRVRNADFQRISVERLTAMINGLGSRVEVTVKVRRAPARPAAAVACTEDCAGRVTGWGNSGGNRGRRMG
jgi:hypothetical protein